ncbi:hypothetical protein BGP_6403 [Beggiatoa sp. PS]|nr:hypothetical protein BGP_6403 [Beggiatoa sp. PS]
MFQTTKFSSLAEPSFIQTFCPINPASRNATSIYSGFGSSLTTSLGGSGSGCGSGIGSVAQEDNSNILVANMIKPLVFKKIFIKFS